MNARTLTVIAGLLGLAACSQDAPAPTDSAAAPPAAGASSAGRPARTSWGDPNIEGTYTNKDENGTPFERPDDLAGKNRGDFGPQEMASLVVARREAAERAAPGIGGRDTGAGPTHWYEHLDATNSRPWFVTEPADGKIPPITDAARDRAAAQRTSFALRNTPNSYTDMSLYDRCITIGLPGSMMPMIYGNAYEITQSPGYVAIRYEMVHETRVIPLDGSPHVASSIDFYMGDARGRWEGDTLVVETTNIKPQAAYRNASENLKIIERFTPTEEGLSWQVRFEDPATWTAPWAFEMPLKRSAEAAPFEYACHEGNLGLANILSAARATEREAGAAPPRRTD